MSPKQRDELLAALKARFDANKARHPGLVWARVQARLESNPDKLRSLHEMERTGGEPDVVVLNHNGLASTVFPDRCHAIQPLHSKDANGLSRRRNAVTSTKPIFSPRNHPPLRQTRCKN
ncbi:MAG TPA: DUF4256 domain-containing protein [Verrucomicrobiae bacterium]|nr:DUF4256 domain-containing protein [Verrucomicrobiae bacterium]